MKYRRKPEVIDVVEFDPNRPAQLTKDYPIELYHTGSDEWKVKNDLHNRWIGLKPRDMIRVDKADEGDVYPIDRETFDRTYELVEE